MNHNINSLLLNRLEKSVDVRARPILASGSYLDSSLPNPDSGIPHTSRDMMNTDAQGNLANRDDMLATGTMEDH